MNKTNRYIVITSIQAPTPAVRRLATLPDWQLIVVGDRKTPRDWSCENVIFLGVEEQAKLGFRTHAELPYGHYARKNLGYLYAMREGAELIYETDDDNLLIPPSVPVSPQRQRVETVTSPDRFVNIYRHYTSRPVWPRGFPLDLIKSRNQDTVAPSDVSVPIQQGLANNDPDVDAIYRLVHGELFDFERAGRYALGAQMWCPFNSQATLWYPDAFWSMLLPGAVPMRVTDIWRGYVAQVLLARYGHSVLFTEPTMRQDRNVHNLLRDFSEEIALYQDVYRLVETVAGTANQPQPGALLLACYQALVKAKLVGEPDLRLTEAWCEDLAAMK